MSVIEPQESSGPPVVRWVKDPIVAEPCNICKGPTVRCRQAPRGLPRPEAQGGEAQFRLCIKCDGIHRARPPEIRA